MEKKPITPLDPLAVVYPAGNNMFHAAQSIRKYGPIKHAAAYAQLLLDRGYAKNAAEALQQAAAEMANVDRLLRDIRLHKEAHQSLQQDAKKAEEDNRTAAGSPPCAFDLNSTSLA